MKPRSAPRLDLTSLRWSVAVASKGGFRKAADAIGVEQSALSRRVRALEDEIGVSLFHRNPGGATLTFAGASFIKGVEHALGLLNETVTEAQEAGRGRLGRLRIGLTGSFLSETLFGVLQHFRGAQRVFNQMEACGVTGGYDVDEDNDGRRFGVVYLVFDAAETEAYPADALQAWVEALITRYGDNAQDMFDRLDMKVFETARPKPEAKTGRKTLKPA